MHAYKIRRDGAASQNRPHKIITGHVIIIHTRVYGACAATALQLLVLVVGRVARLMLSYFKNG